MFFPLLFPWPPLWMSTLKLNELVRMNGNRNLSSSFPKELLHWSQSQLSLWECDKLAEKSPVSSFGLDLHLYSNVNSINNWVTAVTWETFQDLRIWEILRALLGVCLQRLCQEAGSGWDCSVESRSYLMRPTRPVDVRAQARETNSTSGSQACSLRLNFHLKEKHLMDLAD